MGQQFRHTLVTNHHCKPCIKKYKCKKNVTKKDKEEREKIFKEKGQAPVCSLCKESHWRCKIDAYQQCCKLNKCDGILHGDKIMCQNCIDDDIECKRTFPTNLEDFEYFKKYEITYISNKLEISDLYE